jgi:hypothetical protein
LKEYSRRNAKPEFLEGFRNENSISKRICRQIAIPAGIIPSHYTTNN